MLHNTIVTMLPVNRSFAFGKEPCSGSGENPRFTLLFNILEQSVNIYWSKYREQPTFMVIFAATISKMP